MATEVIAVLYHYPCVDGVYGALASWLYYTRGAGQVRSGGQGVSKFSSAGSRPQPKVTFVPMTVYSSVEDRLGVLDSLPSGLDVVYLVDYCGGKTFLRALSALAKRVFLIDHHKSASDDLDEMKNEDGGVPGNLKVVFDLDKSGATLARDFFFPQPENWSSVLCGLHPNLDDAACRDALDRAFALVEDNDLWKHALADSKAFAAGMKERGIEFDASANPEVFQTLCTLDISEVVCAGRTKLAQDKQLIEEQVKRAFVLKIPTWENKSVDASQDDQQGHHNAVVPGSFRQRKLYSVVTTTPELRSEMGHQLALKSSSVGKAGWQGIGAVVYQEPSVTDDLLKVSLRSVGDVDTIAISKLYGGGGHRNASSFMISTQVFET